MIACGPGGLLDCWMIAPFRTAFYYILSVMWYFKYKIQDINTLIQLLGDQKPKLNRRKQQDTGSYLCCFLLFSLIKYNEISFKQKEDNILLLFYYHHLRRTLL